VKTKISNKLNILLIAITLLLLFVIGFNQFGKTNSWLIDSESIGFNVNVEEIDMTIKQGERQITNDGYIYLNTSLIEADTKYLTNTGEDNSVTITNDETGVGYYVRFQAIALINGVAYNINHFITKSDFVNRQDDDNGWWMYSVDDKNATTPKNSAIEAKTTLVLMEDLKFSSNFVSKVQGQYFKLYLFIEGSANGTFSNATA
jgi:hypothetical protein